LAKIQASWPRPFLFGTPTHSGRFRPSTALRFFYLELLGTPAE